MIAWFGMYTKEQLQQHILPKLGINNALFPSKKHKTRQLTPEVQLNYIDAPLSTYGQRLYKIVMGGNQ